MLYAVIVIYNKKCEESMTIRCLKAYKNTIRVALYDNSTKDFGNQSFCEQNDFFYYGTGQNVGLSKAYNYVISRLDLKENDFVMILDEDTRLTPEYLHEAEMLVVQNGAYEICLPVVMANDFIMSPANIKAKCGSRIIKDISEIDLRTVTAINSGMIVRASVYRKIRYNEALFLDMVDHDFMRRAHQQGMKIKCLDSRIYQNYSREEMIPKESALTRYKIYHKDFKTYAYPINPVFYYLSLWKYTVVQTKKYRTLDFLKAFFR